MFLKSIKAQGFKSFADKLDLEINPGITGIVGPNGSGKSNIVDAVRWVLGEQSVKSLRGSSSMSDVIFNGSASRDAQKRAMVALTFDNTDHALNSEFQEIEIKRVVYKTGENEYYINNSRVRLKDINDLFIDSGAGASAFNIISQGNVTDIVNGKSSDRRVIFESAAGVLKYKKRKEESLKKLEKTEENLTRLDLVINELEKTVKPLEEQSKVAKKYLEIKDNLENIDIALMVSDITSINSEYQKLKSSSEILKEKLSTLSEATEDTKLDKLKLENITIEEKINKLREELTNIQNKINELESEKKITIERQKYEVDKKAIDNNLFSLKEQQLELEKSIAIFKKDVEDIESNINEEKEKLEDVKNKILVKKVKRSTTYNKLMEETKKIYLWENKIAILENNINNYENTPLAVKNILNNPRLKGIHNTIGKLIDCSDKYVIALDIAMGGASNYLVVDDETRAIEAIDYLKSQKLGRATFYPLNIIKPRYIEKDVIDSIRNINGFIGVLADLVEYDYKYKNVIDRELGAVLVVENARCLNIIAKLVDYKYKVVSLDGEISYPGGAVAGGTSKRVSMINEKNELNKLKEEKEILKINSESLSNELDKFDEELKDLEEKENVINKYIILLNDELFNKKTNLSRSTEQYKSISSELNGLNDLKENKLDKHLVKLLEDITNANKEKEIKMSDINKANKQKSEILDEINDLEHKQREANSNYNLVNNELKNNEIAMGKLEVKLDNLLGTLNDEYNLTYEYASVSYTLSMDAEIAREKVTSLKKELNKLGDVNIGSIKEYERLSTRYEFLTSQKSDLENSSQELKDIIHQMDDIMISKFRESFDKIKVEFAGIFKAMFKGGNGELRLSNPDDILETGVDIIAIPPGKKINSPVLLSGGEKALTAICLLFAILKVKPAPFVILDEAEAALDEVNVDMFGKYLEKNKLDTQFIVITHKKRMMEYCDSLYGITMQESGVSKIVSAKLES